MTDALPLIRALEDCDTDQERAIWLNTCRLDMLGHCEIELRDHLRWRGFLEGVRLLDIELAAQRRERRTNGSHYQHMELSAARGRMHGIALGLPPRGMGGLA